MDADSALSQLVEAAAMAMDRPLYDTDHNKRSREELMALARIALTAALSLDLGSGVRLLIGEQVGWEVRDRTVEYEDDDCEKVVGPGWWTFLYGMKSTEAGLAARYDEVAPVYRVITKGAA